MPPFASGLNRLSECSSMNEEYNFVLIPPASVPLWWPQLEALLIARPETWEKYMELSTIYDWLTSGELQFGSVLRKTELVVAALCRVQDFDRRRVFVAVWAGGEAWPKVGGLLTESLEHLAKSWGCSEFQIEAQRKGWCREMQKFGFTTKRYIVSKELKPLTLN